MTHLDNLLKRWASAFWVIWVLFVCWRPKHPPRKIIECVDVMPTKTLCTFSFVALAENVSPANVLHIFFLIAWNEDFTRFFWNMLSVLFIHIFTVSGEMCAECRRPHSFAIEIGFPYQIVVIVIILHMHTCNRIRNFIRNHIIQPKNLIHIHIFETIISSAKKKRKEERNHHHPPPAAAAATPTPSSIPTMEKRSRAIERKSQWILSIGIEHFGYSLYSFIIIILGAQIHMCVSV